MTRRTISDFAPFQYEPMRRADRTVARDKEQELARQQSEALSLLRSASNPRDSTLTKLAEEWRDRLLAQLQTRALCERYPRIANRIALCWSDRTLTQRLLDQLLHDRRAGRKGFPAAVRAELVALAVAVGSDIGR